MSTKRPFSIWRDECGEPAAIAYNGQHLVGLHPGTIIDLATTKRLVAVLNAASRVAQDGRGWVELRGRLNALRRFTRCFPTTFGPAGRL